MMAVGTWRAVWLLSRLRLQRLANMLLTMKFGRKRATSADPAAPARAPTPGKRRGGALLAVLMVALMSFSFLNIARQSVLNMQCQLAPGSSCAQAAQVHRALGERQAALELARDGYSEPVTRALGLQLTLLLLVSFLTPLGSKDIASTDWDLEWLVTLPVPRTTLLAARVAERSVANPTGLFALIMPCAMTAWYAGCRWSAPLAALAAAAALLPIAAMLRTVVDTGLRLALAPSALRNLQAICGVAALPFLYMAMAFGMSTSGAMLAQFAARTPHWIGWTPSGLAVGALAAGTPARALPAIAMLLAELAAILLLGMLVLRHQLRNGVVGGGVRETGRRVRPAAAGPVDTRDTASPARAWDAWLPRSPIQRRELRLLSRDRNFLVQSLLMPIVIIGSQVVMGGHLHALATLGAHPLGLGLAAFGVAAYMLMLSAFQTINSEGQSLWMLYTFPAPLDAILRDKARLWAVLALVYPAILFALGLGLGGHVDWHLGGIVLIVLAGIPAFSVIAVALGVLASDPLSQDARNRLQPTYVYLYMLLASLYAYAIYARVWWQAIVVMVLTAGLAQAFWQKARDALPYLLDPAARPPARVSTADGMIAVMLFFVLQSVAALFIAGVIGDEPGRALLFAYALAGIAVYLLTRLFYWRSKTSGVPALLPGRLLGTLPAALGLGLGTGLVAALFGVGYLAVLRHTPWWDAHLRALAQASTRLPVYWTVLLAVVAAPLCEEFIFRGLLFGGLRRSMAFLPAAALSAALFAIVHPPASIVPVFALGLCTAFAYERGRGLLAPMLVHAVYNGAVVAFQLLA